MKMEDAPATIRQKALQIEHLLRAAPIGYCLVDSELRYVQINEQLARINGPSVEEHLGRTLREVLPDLADDIEPLYEMVIASGEPIVDVEVSGSTQAWSGTALVSHHPFRDRGGAIVGVSTIVQDITAQKEAEREIRDSEARYRTLVEHAPEAIVILDAESGRFIDGNANAETLFGMTREELCATGPLGLSPSEQPGGEASADAAARYVDLALAGAAPVFEWVHTNAGRDEIPCEVRLVRLPASDRKLVRGSVIDISERKRITEAQQQAQRLESLGVMAGGIAHDFNNLLVGILGNAELARARLPEGSPADPLVEAIERAGQAAADLVRQMLTYAGRVRASVRPVLLNDLIREMVDLIRSVRQARVELLYELADDLPAIEADVGQMRQVVLNLITNAAEALEERQGTIRVTTAAARFALDELRDGFPHQSLEPGDYVMLEVADTGCGMDAATAARMFEPFFTTKFTGRGLGLAALRGIVNAHGGGVRVRTAPGAGTAVRLLFPVTDAVAGVESELPEAEPRAGTSGEAMSVLFVDDEEAVREVARLSLESAGVGVRLASDGAEGVARLREMSDGVDVVVLDRTMPGPSTRETLEAMRAIQPDLRVLLSSGQSKPVALDDLPVESLAGFLQKPYRPRELVAAVRSVARIEED